MSKRVMLEFCVSIAVVFLAAKTVCSQSHFVSVPKSDIDNVIIDFAKNRELFAKYCVHVEIEELNESSLRVDSPIRHFVEYCLAEDFSKRQSRLDFRRISYDVDGQSRSVDWVMKFTDKGHETIRDELRQYAPEANKSVSKILYAHDVWMLPISELLMLSVGDAGGSLYWSELLDSDRLLWAESDGKITRGEWKIARRSEKVQECYVQVYFDSSTGNMPVLTRFICPTRYDEKFAKQGKSFCCEIETKWEKLEDGYVPTQIHNRRVSFFSKGGWKNTMDWSFKFNWKSELCKINDSITEGVFQPGVFPSERILRSFK